jgi:hypothetical protein
VDDGGSPEHSFAFGVVQRDLKTLLIEKRDLVDVYTLSRLRVCTVVEPIPMLCLEIANGNVLPVNDFKTAM